jgi:WD40 repeat protein
METLEVWEFTDQRPSGKHVRYQLENRDGRLSIHSDDPELSARSVYAIEPVLKLLKYLIENAAGKEFPRTTVEATLWPPPNPPRRLDTYLLQLRKLLDDDRTLNKRNYVQCGRIVQTLKGGYLRFTPKFIHTPLARIQKTTQLGPFSSVPPKLHYIPRPDIFDPLVQELCSGMGQAVGLTAVQGMGGVGKTTLAIAASHDERVRAAFPDGIVWIRIGNDSTETLDQRVTAICDALNARFEKYSTATLQTLLSDKAVLLVLDDVWRLEDVEPFLITSPRSRLLFTTRDKGIALSLRIDAREVGELDNAMARSFLTFWSRHQAALPEPEASDILVECGGLALAVSMVGAVLTTRDREGWGRVLRDLRRARLHQIGTNLPGYRYGTIDSAMAVSVDALDGHIRSHYLSLAILTEGFAATPPVLQRLWTESEDKVDWISQVLVDRSLARREFGGIVLHDLQLAYLRSHDSNPKALELQRAAFRRSANIIRRDPKQLASQMTARLLGLTECGDVAQLLDRLWAMEPRPRMRPLLESLSPPSGGSTIVLEDSAWRGILAMTITADGTRAVLRTRSGFVCWHITQRRVRHVEAEDVSHWKVGVSLDGNRAAFCSLEQGTVLCWDLAVGGDPVVVATIGEVRSFAISSNGKRAACALADDRIAICDLDSGSVRYMVGKQVNRNAINLSGDGRRLIFGSQCELCVWAFEDGDEVTSVRVWGVVDLVALNDAGDRVIYVHNSCEREIDVWDIQSGAPPWTVWSDSRNIRNLALTADGHAALFSTEDGSILVCELNRGRAFREYRTPSKNSHSVVSSGGYWGLSTAADFEVTLWNLTATHDLPVSQHHSCVAVSRDEKRAITLRANGDLAIWTLDQIPQYFIICGGIQNQGGFLKPTLFTSDEGSRAFALACDGKAFAYWNIDSGKPPFVWNTPPSGDNEGPPPRLNIHGRPCGALSGDGRRAIVKPSDSPASVWDFDQAPPVARTLKGSENITAVTIVDKSHAIAGTKDLKMCVWDLDTCECTEYVDCAIGPSELLCRIPSRSNAACSVLEMSVWGEVFEWMFAEGEVSTFNLGNHWSYAHTLSNNRECLFSISHGPGNEQTAFLWNLRERARHSFRVSDEFGVQWRPTLNRDGTRLAVARRNELLVFDVLRQEQLAAFTADADWEWCQWVGSRIMGADHSGRMHILAWEEETTSFGLLPIM